MGMCVTPVPAVGDTRWGSAIPATITTLVPAHTPGGHCSSWFLFQLSTASSWKPFWNCVLPLPVCSHCPLAQMPHIPFVRASHLPAGLSVARLWALQLRVQLHTHTLSTVPAPCQCC